MPKRISGIKIKYGWGAATMRGHIGKTIGVSFVLSAIAFPLLFVYYAKDLPRPEKFTEKKTIESTKIYDSSGEVLLYELYGEEKRTLVRLEDVPDHLKWAVLAAEDSNFYGHFGLEPSAIIRSIIADIKLGQPVYGGSTISQQLVRSAYLSTEKSLSRKIKEVILTLELERRYSKDQILEFYLNQVPFGNNAYGVEAAGQTYFNKTVKELSVAEAATLAALIKKPSYLGDLASHKNDLLARSAYVLRRMYQDGYITEAQKDEALKENLRFGDVYNSLKAPHFTLAVVEQLKKIYGDDFLRENGLRVYTSLDWEMQEQAEKIVLEGAENNKAFNAYNASMVAIDPLTGRVLVMVGSKNYFGESEGCSTGNGCMFDPKVNVATYFLGRQPGSAFKPFVYATAFRKGYTDQTVVVDEPTNFGVYGGKFYEPQNFDGKFRGPVTLRQALAQSLNVPSVKVLAYLAGLNDSIKTAQDMGITTLNNDPSYYGLSLVLGGGEVKLLDMVSAYGVLASDGVKVAPATIVKILDQRGRLIYENNKTPKRVLEADVARLISDILSDNKTRSPIFGANSSLYIPGYSVAAKTGTTQDFKDGWILGYTPNIVVGVWAGNNNGAPMLKEPGVVVAGPIWKRFFTEVVFGQK